MDKDTLIHELETLIGGFLKTQGLDLIELILRYESQGLVLRIVTDRPEGGITLGECALLNSRIGGMLDEKDIIRDRYILEVSSPGMDRPMKTKSDFLRCLNREIRLFLKEAFAGKIEWEGALKEAKEDSLVIETDEGEVEIPIDKIARGKQRIS